MPLDFWRIVVDLFEICVFCPQMLFDFYFSIRYFYLTALTP